MANPENAEYVARRRHRVLEWVSTARRAVLTFQRASDGSFWKDTKLAISRDETALNGTTTSRCYMALVYADRCLPISYEDSNWKRKFQQYATALDVNWVSGVEPCLVLTGSTNKEELLNHFEIAHLADLVFVKDYLERFDRMAIHAPALEDSKLRDPLANHFQELTTQLQTFGSLQRAGRLPMAGTEGEHAFVNLHAARAHAILGLQPGWLRESIEPMKQYCIEQCFYAQRGLGHKLDIFQLILAGVTCALLDDERSVDLYEAVIDVISGAQLPGGNWPATHPVFLPGGKPWHITSHEMALCLTWFYYADVVPERGRQKILTMMNRYFEQWVIRTYVAEEQQYSGWYDDHHVVDHYVVGWATSIVCHFLANYYWILGHEVNRLAIESLGLEDSAENYSFDDTAPARARRLFDGKRPTWADLPPHAWDPDKTVEDVAAQLRNLWTDPSQGKVISEELSKKIIAPILDASSAGPAPSKCTGLLNGPPGTGKTSLVQQVAKVVRWPLIVIRAIAWDEMQARQTDVFRKLRLLSNCVLFFDDYEECLRMLPLLNELGDEGRCLVFLATSVAESSDIAARRRGRFDFQFDVKHPLSERAVEFVDETDSNIRKEIAFLARERVPLIVQGVKDAIRHYVTKNGHDAPIPFKNIENALRSAARAANGQIEAHARRELERGVDTSAPDLSQLD